MEKKINDFGMKIDGARKNKKEENKETPLPKMSNPENFLLIGRDNIWPETNGEELVASGIPQGIAYWREQIRKAIPPHPSKADERSMINYFNVVSELKEQVNQVNEPEDVESFYHFLHQHYLTDSDDYHIFVTDPAKDVVSQKLLQEAQTEYCTYEHKARKIFFGISQKDRAALRKQQKENAQNNKSNPDSPYDNRKKPFPIPKLSTFMRKGPAYLPAGSHAGKEEFLALGIRGVEFGLWMSDADAQAALDQCYHALHDLAYVLDIAPEDISFGGKLALSFGARGHGEVLADYQAKQQLICLPNGNGNGFLAHAWAYAFDEYIAQGFGKSFSQMADYELWHYDMNATPTWVKEFLGCFMWQTITITADEQNAMKEQEHQYYIQKNEQVLAGAIDSITPKQLTKKQQVLWDNAVQEVYNNRCLAKMGMYSGVNGVNPAVENLSAVYKEITGRSIPKRKRSSINYDLAMLSASERPFKPATQAIQKKDTNNFSDGSWEMRRYFAKTAHGDHYEFCERFARAFDCYVADKLKKAGIQNQYLTAHSEAFVFRDKNGEIIYAMPTGKEREQINQKFDGLILMLKEMGLFHPRELPEQNLEINKKHLTPYSSKISIAAIRSLVAEQRQNTGFVSKYHANQHER